MTAQECAEEFGKDYQTILRWIRSGKLPAKRTGLREYYIDLADIDKFCTDNDIVRKSERG
jgi:excisionase family DNA binding protein